MENGKRANRILLCSDGISSHIRRLLAAILVESGNNVVDMDCVDCIELDSMSAMHDVRCEAFMVEFDMTTISAELRMLILSGRVDQSKPVSLVDTESMFSINIVKLFSRILSYILKDSANRYDINTHGELIESISETLANTWFNEVDRLGDHPVVSTAWSGNTVIESLDDISRTILDMTDSVRVLQQFFRICLVMGIDIKDLEVALIRVEQHSH